MVDDGGYARSIMMRRLRPEDEKECRRGPSWRIAFQPVRQSTNRWEHRRFLRSVGNPARNCPDCSYVRWRRWLSVGAETAKAEAEYYPLTRRSLGCWF